MRTGSLKIIRVPDLDKIKPNPEGNFEKNVETNRMEVEKSGIYDKSCFQNEKTIFMLNDEDEIVKLTPKW